MQQLNLPSNNISNYSNVSKQSESLVSGLNNISFDSYNNTCIFNNKMFSMDTSITIDLINKLFYNIEGISFSDRSIIKGISDGYTIDENEDLVLDYNSDVALSTVFGYNIKNQSDLTDNNLSIEIMSRQADSNILKDTITEVELKAIHAESMIHYINYDLINHIMIFTIPIPDETSTTSGYLDQLSSEKIIGLTDEEIKTSDPNKGLTIDEPIKYIDFNVAQFDENGMYAPLISSDLLIMDQEYGEIHSPNIASTNILNEEIIQTGDIIFYNKPHMVPNDIILQPDENGKIQTGILNGIDTDMHIVEIDPLVISQPNYDGTCFTHTVCSYLIRDHIEQLYMKIAYLGLRIDTLTDNLYDPKNYMTKVKEIPFLDPYSSDGSQLGEKTIVLESQNLSKYKFLEKIWSLQDQLNKLPNTSPLLKCWDLGKLDNAFSQFSSTRAVIFEQENAKYLNTFSTVTIHGDLEVQGNIFLVEGRTGTKYDVYRKKNKDPNDDALENGKVYAPLYHTHDYASSNHTHEQYALQSNIDTLRTELETFKNEVKEELTSIKNNIIEIKEFIKLCTWNTYKVEIPSLELIDV